MRESELALGGSEWALRSLLAAILLTVGSSILLAGAIGVVWLGWGAVWVFVTGISAMLIHLIGWLGLAYSLLALLHVDFVRPLYKWGIVACFLVSLPGYVVGVLLSQSIVGSALPLPLPYFPSVYMVVVAAHGAMFLLGSRTVQTRKAPKFLIGGGSYLLAISAVAAVGFVALPPTLSLLLLLPGLSALGYFLVGVGWRREYGVRQQFRSLGGEEVAQ